MSRREWTISVPAATPWIVEATRDRHLPRVLMPWITATVIAARAARLPYLPHAYLVPVVHMPSSKPGEPADYQPTLHAVLEGLTRYGLIPGVEPRYYTLAGTAIGQRVQAQQLARYGLLALTIRERAPDRPRRATAG